MPQHEPAQTGEELLRRIRGPITSGSELLASIRTRKVPVRTDVSPSINFDASEKLGLLRPAPPDIAGAAERAAEPIQAQPLVADVTALGPPAPRVEAPQTLEAPTDRLGQAIGQRLAAEDIAAIEEFGAKAPIVQDVSRVLAGVARAPFVGSVPRALGVDPEEQARIDPGARGAVLRGAGTLLGVGGEILATKGLAALAAPRAAPGPIGRPGLQSRRCPRG